MNDKDLSQYDEQYVSRNVTEVDETFVRKIVPYLSNTIDKPNEQILWMGQPSRWIVLRKIDWQLIPVSLLILWFLYRDYSMGTMMFDLSIYSIVVYLLLFYLYIGRFIHDITRRSHIKYAISEQQIFIQSGIVKSQIEVFQINEWDLLLHQRRSGKGTIKLQKKNSYPLTGLAKFLHNLYIPKGFRAFSAIAGYSSTPRLESINNAREIYEMMVNPLLKIQRKEKEVSL